MDAETGEPMPLVSIVFVGTTIGVTTDFDGNYDMETREDVSEIMASFVSYERQTVAIKKGAENGSGGIAGTERNGTGRA